MSADRKRKQTLLFPSAPAAVKSLHPSSWPKWPLLNRHPTLGRRQTWTRSDGLAMVQRFSEGSGKFICFVRPDLDGCFLPLYGGGFSRLRDAQRYCDRHYGKAEDKGREEREEGREKSRRKGKLRRRLAAAGGAVDSG